MISAILRINAFTNQKMKIGNPKSMWKRKLKDADIFKITEEPEIDTNEEDLKSEIFEDRKSEILQDSDDGYLSSAKISDFRSSTNMSIIPEKLDELKEEITKLGKVLVRTRSSSESEYKLLRESIANISVGNDDIVEDRKSEILEEIVGDLFSIVDGLDAGIRAGQEISDDGIDSWISGIEIVQQRIIELLEKLNIQPIDCLGNQFDPSFHIAVGVANNQDFDDNTIIDEHRRGYMRNGKVLRYAEVVVNKFTNYSLVND
jgi:molecular chaperone GrpE